MKHKMSKWEKIGLSMMLFVLTIPFGETGWEVAVRAIIFATGSNLFIFSD